MRFNPRFVPRLIALALALTSLTAVLTLTPGCSTPNRTAYVVEGVTINSVETATKVFLDLVVAGKVTTAQEVQYRRIYNKYLAAQRVVQDLVQNAQPGVPIDRTLLNTALSAVATSSADVINFVGQFSNRP